MKLKREALIGLVLSSLLYVTYLVGWGMDGPYFTSFTLGYGTALAVCLLVIFGLISRSDVER